MFFSFFLFCFLFGFPYIFFVFLVCGVGYFLVVARVIVMFAIVVVQVLFLIDFFLFRLFFGVFLVAPGSVSVIPVQVKVSNDPARSGNAKFVPGTPDVLGTVRLGVEVILEDVLDASGTAEGAFTRDVRVLCL